MHWIDAHAHLSFFSIEEIEQLLHRANSKNLKQWVMAGYNATDWEQQLQIHRRYPMSVKMCFGLHPWQVVELSASEIEKQMFILQHQLPLAQACGETGIDKLKGPQCLDQQREVFIRHLELNKQPYLPLVLHSVHADQEVLEILKNYSFTGIVHRFSGSYEIAKRYLDLGYKLSISRNILSSGYKKMKECVERLPMKDFVIESDAELDQQGQPEDALTLFLSVAQALADTKKISLDEVMYSSYENTKKVFG